MSGGNLTSAAEQQLALGTDTIWLLLTGINILLMQVGFTAFESGASRAKHVKSVLFKNFLDHSIGAIAWFFVGWGIFSGDEPWFGMGNFGDPHLDEFPKLFQQFGFAATASTIISGAVSGRLRLEAYIFLSMIICGLTYPICAHWMWGAHGWLRNLGFLDFAGSCVVHVFGGSCAFVAAKLVESRPGRFQYQRRRSAAIEATATSSTGFQRKQQQHPTLSALGTEGGRDGSADNNTDDEAEPAAAGGSGKTAAAAASASLASPVRQACERAEAALERATAFVLPGLYTAAPMPPAGNALIMVFGALVLYVSWFSFNTGSSGSAVQHSYQSARAAVNTLICSGAGCTTFFLLSAAGLTGSSSVGQLQRNSKLYRRAKTTYNMERACNALLISLAAITGPCGYVHPWAAVLAGVFAVAFVYPFGDFVVLRVFGVDDTLGAVTVHAFGGAFGSLWLGLMHPDDGAFYNGGNGHLFGVQLLGVLVTAVFAAVTTLVVLMPFRVGGVLRYSLEEQLLGIDFLHFGGEDGRDVDLDSDSRSAGGMAGGGADDASDMESLTQRSTANVSSLNEPQIILTPLNAHSKPQFDVESQHSATTLSTNTAEGRREAGNQLKRALDDEDPRLRRRFRAYLKVLHAGESVEFWDAVNKWRRLQTDKKRTKESIRIINTFCLEDSPTQVNLKSTTVTKLRDALANPRTLARFDLFDDCLDELFKDLKQTFVEFVEKTPNYWL